jgi:hypothetical protein
MTGPAMTTPMPTAADARPPSATDPVALVTRVSTPTTIIAKGSRAMKAIGKYPHPVWWIRVGCSWDTARPRCGLSNVPPCSVSR